MLVDDGHGDDDPLHLVVEIKGYRREDAKEKKATMETYWVPGVNNLGSYGRWAFAEFTEVYQIESDFKAKVEAEFNKMIDSVAAQGEKKLMAKKKKPKAKRKTRRSPYARGSLAQEHPHRRIPVGDAKDEQSPIRVAYERRNRDLDPQLVWRGKDEQDWSDLVVHAPPLYIQEKVHPKVLIDDLLAAPNASRERSAGAQIGPFRRFQRPAERGRQDRVLPARRQLVQPHDPRRQPAGHGQPGRARGPARARCSASISIRPTASSSTPISSGPRPAAT